METESKLQELLLDLVELHYCILRRCDVVKHAAMLEIQELVDCICTEHNLKPITATIRDVTPGTAWRKPRFIIIPLWALGYNIFFVYWYAIHEVAHIMCSSSAGHVNDEFRETERMLLHRWGMAPEYGEEFPNIMYSTLDASTVLFDLSDRIVSTVDQHFVGTPVAKLLLVDDGYASYIILPAVGNN